MSEEPTIADISARVDGMVKVITDLAKLGPLFRVVIVGTFILGGWAASLQFTITAVRSEQDAIRVELKERRQWMDEQDKVIARLTTILENIASRQNEMAEDIKELVKRQK